MQRLDDETLMLIRTGTFEESASYRVLGLIQESVECLIGKQTADLLRMLEECAGSVDDAVTLIGRYDRSCRCALRLCDVEGLPRAEVDELREGATRYVAGILAGLKEGLAGPGDAAEDIEYCLLKLERRWVARE